MADMKKQLEEVKELVYVLEAAIDGTTLTFTLVGDGGDREQSFMVLLPDEWPSGEPTLMGDAYEILKPANTLSEVVTQVHDRFFASGDDGDETDELGPSYSQDSEDDYSRLQSEPSMGFNDDINQDLLTDVAKVRTKFGETSITVRDHFVRLEKIEVDLLVDTSDILNPLTADAWGVDRNCPITITLHLARSLYNGVEESPRIECFQETRKCPLAAQLRNILQNFCDDVWCKTPEQIEAMRSSLDKQRLEAQQDMVNALLNMGFDPQAVDRVSGLTSTKDEAVELLLSEGHSGKDKPMSDDMAVLTGADVKKTEYDPNKTIPPRNEGFLVQLMEYAKHRLPTCSSYCVICDRKHMFANTSMLKPSVCSRELCVFGFTELKVGADAADDIAAETGVVDLLVCMCKSAAMSSRSDKILTPYPQVVDPKCTSKFALSPDSKDINKVRKIFEAFPSVKDLSQANDIGDIKAKLEAKEPLAYPLLQWIVSSNRSHIVKLPEQNQVKSMQTPHQYLLVSEPPEKQRRFHELKKKHKAKFAFHGSPIENWHSILRNGLQNLSGTSGQLHGAAHGNGIYMAPELNTSLDYAGHRGGGGSGSGKDDKFGQLFLDETKMTCVALCEVIDHEIKDSGWCWVMPHNDHVATRFLFVYDGSSGRPSNVSTKNNDFINEVQEALVKNGLGG
eukprot:TRINITY_DN14359_c0_g1_i1.p1 TRINITY_DN14359_c0_g1~~TRINITY_DN14359_c0_g1_i1.p1  ORF type:complete len:677 (+),score=81.00 TRINITY_DN14359_c0_g1_i1:48-2078(+)